MLQDESSEIESKIQTNSPHFVKLIFTIYTCNVARAAGNVVLLAIDPIPTPLKITDQPNPVPR